MGPLQRIYGGLLIAAFLGNAFFFLLQGLVEADDHLWTSAEFLIRAALGLWLLLYFLVPYLLMQHSKGTYGVLAFVVDCVDLFVIFFAFYFLGFVSTGVTPQVGYVYGLIAVIPILAFLGNRLSPRANRGTRWDVSVLVLVVGVLVPLLGYETSTVANGIALVVLYGALFIYYSRVRIELAQLAQSTA